MEQHRLNMRSEGSLAQQDDWDDVHNQMLEVQEAERVQKKSLAMTTQDDSSETEADDIASKVAGGESAILHGAGGTVNRKSTGDVDPPPQFRVQLQASKGSGQPLDDSTRSEMESKMGADFSGVKIHTDDQANQMSESINAKAFTHGQDVYFKQGQHDTSSRAGKELLAHELVHTVQQRGAISRSIQRKPGDPQWESYTVGADEKSIYSIAVKLRNRYTPVVSGQPVKSVDEISNAIIAHNNKNGVTAGDIIEVPTKAYFEGLGAVPGLRQTDVSMHGGDATRPASDDVLFKEHFQAGAESNYDSESNHLRDALNTRTRFANVDPLLEPYLKNLATSVLGNIKDTSITVMVNFTQMEFTAENFLPAKLPGEKKGALDEIKTDRMYRITTQGDGEQQRIYIEGLGPVKTVKAQTAADFLDTYDIRFVDNISVNKKAYPDMQVLAWNQLATDEKAQVTGAFMKMPDAILETIRGLRIGRADMSQENAELRKRHYVPPSATPDTLAAYYISEHAIIVYDEAFKKSNTVLGDATAGTTSSLEAIIMHEIGHAEDIIGAHHQMAETEAYKEYSASLADYRKVQDDADAIYLPKMKPYLDKKAELDHAKTEAGKMVEKDLVDLELSYVEATVAIGILINLNDELDYIKNAQRVLGTLEGNAEEKVPPLLQVCREAAQNYDTSKLKIKEAALRKVTLANISLYTTAIADLLLHLISDIETESALYDLQIAAEVTLDIGIESEPEPHLVKAFPDAKLLLQLAVKHYPDQVDYKAALSSILPGEDGEPDGDKLKKLRDSIASVNSSTETSGVKTASGAKPGLVEGEDPYATRLGVIPAEENMDDNKFQVALQKDFGDYKTISTEDEVDRPTLYSETNMNELYAESFMLYFSDPERFSKMRPHLYMYFENKYHRWEGKL